MHDVYEKAWKNVYKWAKHVCYYVPESKDSQ